VAVILYLAQLHPQEVAVVGLKQTGQESLVVLEVPVQEET
jgi:hypothetical protein